MTLGGYAKPTFRSPDKLVSFYSKDYTEDQNESEEAKHKMSTQHQRKEQDYNDKDFVDLDSEEVIEGVMKVKEDPNFDPNDLEQQANTIKELFAGQDMRHIQE